MGKQSVVVFGFFSRTSKRRSEVPISLNEKSQRPLLISSCIFTPTQIHLLTAFRSTTSPQNTVFTPTVLLYLVLHLVGRIECGNNSFVFLFGCCCFLFLFNRCKIRCITMFRSMFAPLSSKMAETKSSFNPHHLI